MIEYEHVRRELSGTVAIGGDLAKPGAIVDRLANATGATPGQIALAWILKRSEVMLPIPGTSSVKDLEENVAAVAIELTQDEFDQLEAASPRPKRD